jgi:hypothetical protein
MKRISKRSGTTSQWIKRDSSLPGAVRGDEPDAGWFSRWSLAGAAQVRVLQTMGGGIGVIAVLLIEFLWPEKF